MTHNGIIEVAKAERECSTTLISKEVNIFLNIKEFRNNRAYLKIKKVS